MLVKQRKRIALVVAMVLMLVSIPWQSGETVHAETYEDNLVAFYDLSSAAGLSMNQNVSFVYEAGADATVAKFNGTANNTSFLKLPKEAFNSISDTTGMTISLWFNASATASDWSRLFDLGFSDFGSANPFMFLTLLYLFKHDEKTYMKGIISGIIGFIICDIIYLYYPTIMLRPPIPETNALTNLILKITYFFDTPAVNCFPSIHCLFCFQIIFSYLKTKQISLKSKILTIIYSLLIILSTVLVKQHYVFDIISALLICLITNFIVDILEAKNILMKFINDKKLTS